MKRRYFIFIGLAVVIAVLVVVNVRAKRERGMPVQIEEVTRRDLTMVISASGSIRPKRKVDISASTIGKVTKVTVREGDRVREGQFLLQIDPIELQSTVDRLTAMLEAARANGRQAAAQLLQAKNDLDRAQKLFASGDLTTKEIDAIQTAYESAVAREETSRHEIAQAKATLESASHNLDQVTIRAPMSGIVTRRNVEEGEIAIMGTLNNLGTVLLTIADLSTIETEVQVDETEVNRIKLGDRAKVTLDAFPDTSFAGEVTEIGNSPILTSASATQQQGVDFKVIVTVTESIPNVRPGLSADVEITVASAPSALSIPIQSLTVRRARDLKKQGPSAKGKGKGAVDSASAAGAVHAADTAGVARAATDTAGADSELEGVFVIVDGRARFRTVKVGISSQKHFEVLSGVAEKEKVVSGNYRAIRELRDGQRVKVTSKTGKTGAESKQNRSQE